MNRDSATWISATRVWIPIGAALFVVALIGSALILPELRLLHVLQAFIYVAIVILAAKQQHVGYRRGHRDRRLLERTQSLRDSQHAEGGGRVLVVAADGPDRGVSGIPMLVLLGGIGHLLIIAGCLAIAFDRRITDKKLWKMVAGGVVALAYFALIVIVARPR